MINRMSAKRYLVHHVNPVRQSHSSVPALESPRQSPACHLSVVRPARRALPTIKRELAFQPFHESSKRYPEPTAGLGP